MRIIIFFLFCALWACQNQPVQAPPATTAPTSEAQPEQDTLSTEVTNIQGAYRPRKQRVSDNINELTYPGYVVRIETDEEIVGEKVTVTPDGGTAMAIDMPEDGFFLGLWKNYIFLDSGTGPDGRELFVVDLRTNSRLLNTLYVNEASIDSTGLLTYYKPVDEKTLAAKPVCPESEAWVKNGLGIGYARKAVFNFNTKKVTESAQDVICHPLQ